MSTHRALRIGLLGVRRRLTLHDRTEEALHHAVGAIGAARGRTLDLLPRWLAGDELLGDVEGVLRDCDAVLAPGRGDPGWEEAALEAVQVARVLRMPFLATGEGFRLGLDEFVRNALPERVDLDAVEAGTGCVRRARSILAPERRLPRGAEARDGWVDLEPGTRLADTCGRSRVREAFGSGGELEPGLVKRLEGTGLVVAARRTGGEVCGLELVGRMFHVLARYLPQLSSRTGRPHPLFRGWLEAALAQAAPRVPPATPERGATPARGWPQ